MAIFLKNQYQLLTFTITMDTFTPELGVLCSLEGQNDGQPLETLYEWKYPIDHYGMPMTLDRSATRSDGIDFRIPQFIFEALAKGIEKSPDGDDVLWIYLKQPYGYLDMIPWEALLQPRLGIPILRLPEFIVDPPRLSEETLNVVLCTSLPRSKESFQATRHLMQMAELLALLAGPRKLSIDIFTDQALFETMKRDVAESSQLKDIVAVHDPASAVGLAIPESSAQIYDPGHGLENPWLLWMRDALQGKSVDMVHFMAHGYYAQEKGALSFAQSPTQNQDERIARFVGATEISTFLTQTAAWSVAFSSPNGNYSQMGLRHLANEVAQKRPGPLIHHDLKNDDTCEALASGYQFLFVPDAAPPKSPALIVYSHPARVVEKLASASKNPGQNGRTLGTKGIDVLSGFNRSEALSKESVVPSVASTSTFENLTNKRPERDGRSWVDAAERHLDLRTLELGRKMDADNSHDQETLIALGTLNKVRQVLALGAKSSGNSLDHGDRIQLSDGNGSTDLANGSGSTDVISDTGTQSSIHQRTTPSQSTTIPAQSVTAAFTPLILAAFETPEEELQRVTVAARNLRNAVSKGVAENDQEVASCIYLLCDMAPSLKPIVLELFERPEFKSQQGKFTQFMLMNTEDTV